MPKRFIAKSVEVGLTRCRSQAATLDDELLIYLIDITLLHLRKKAARPGDIPKVAAADGGGARVENERLRRRQSEVSVGLDRRLTTAAPAAAAALLFTFGAG